MSLVRIIYLGAGGQYRRKRGKVTVNHPNYLHNGGDKQAHVLREGPIFPEVKPVPRVEILRELVTMDLPPQPIQIERRAMLCEDNYPWPVASHPFQDSGLRMQEIDDAGEEGTQMATGRASRDDESPYTKGGYVLALVIGLVSILLITVMILPKLLEKYG